MFRAIPPDSHLYFRHYMVFVCLGGENVLHHDCRGQRTTCGNYFSLTLWVPGTELGLSGFVLGTTSCSAISLVLRNDFQALIWGHSAESRHPGPSPTAQPPDPLGPPLPFTSSPLPHRPPVGISQGNSPLPAKEFCGFSLQITVCSFSVVLLCVLLLSWPCLPGW